MTNLAMYRRRRQQDLGPLVILGGCLFIVILVAIIPVEDLWPILAYLPPLGLLAGILYVKGVKPIDPDFPASLFWLAFIGKLVGSAIYYWVLLDVYGRGDANIYHREGQYVAQALGQFDFSIFSIHFPGSQGSTNMALITGVLYTFFPPSLPGSGFFFSSLAFAGSVFFYRAFRLGFPEANPSFYRFIVFFLPSLLFWPSALGKEAWILFGSGLVAYGLAKFARQARLSGLLPVGAGLYVIYLPRPHFAAFMVIAAGAAYLLFYRTNSPAKLLAWLVGGGMIVALGFFVLEPAGAYVGLGPLSETSFDEVQSVYEFRQGVTLRGGSSFAPPSAFGPAGPLYALVTVLFRPFPWEAHNAQAMASALESVLWLGLFWSRRRVLWARLRFMIKGDPWIAFALGYSAIMIMALTVAANFGILVRERVTFLPFLWVLFA